MSRLVVVTATTDLSRSLPTMKSWGPVPIVCVLNGTGEIPQAGQVPTGITLLRQAEYLGTVAAFQVGVNYVLKTQPHAEMLACLHDDLILQDPDWDGKVEKVFDRHPEVGLLGFGGAIGLGAEDIYRVPYQPQQLARVGFRSNLVDAEVHGLRSLLQERVACLDGFSQVGRKAFWLGHAPSAYGGGVVQQPRPWDLLHHLGVVHHAYDGMLGCIAARLGWQVWYLPIRCHHLGGQTAVGDQGYATWAKGQIPGGDAGFWETAHRVWYDAFRDVLPIRL